MKALGISDDINDFLLQLYRIAKESPMAAFQDSALAQLKTVLPFDSSMWGTATTRPAGIDIHTIHLHQKDPQMIVEYEGLKHFDTAAAAVFGKSRITNVYNSDEWFGEKDQREYREFLTRWGHDHTFITAASNPVTNFVHWVSLFRGNTDAVCKPEEQRLLYQLSPHIMQALAMNRVMHLQGTTVARASAPMRGNAIADLRGVLYHTDLQFEMHAQAEWAGWNGLKLPDEMMLTMGRANGTHVGRVSVVQWAVDQRLLFLRSRGRCLADDLTERELTVARLLSAGKSHKEVAKGLDRSPATVRNQTQSIYGKLQVGSVAQMSELLRQLD